MINRIGRKMSAGRGAALALVFALGASLSAKAQPAPASIHGHVNNPIGSAITKGEVRLTQDRSGDEKSRKYTNTFPIDTNGDFKGTGIAPGSYVAIVYVDDKSIDFQDNVTFAAGEDKMVNFDMSRKEYIDKMTPEEKKQLEEFKKKNADVTQANAKIANLNALLTQARADTKAGNFDAAISSMQQATTAKPDEGILWVALGDAQLGSADAAAKAAKAAGKPADPAVQAKYTEAAASYKKAVDANAASKKPNPETTAAAYNQMGQALAKSGDGKGAGDAYEQAAKAKPDNAGMYYYNEAATLYNAGKLDDAAVAADKAIAADPKRADAYYIKGQSLIPKASVDPKTQKIVAPPGCVEAYQEFVDLASANPAEQARVEEVKGILTGIGAEIKSSYKATKSKK
ncbi:MAG: tetratricopeptide repeat protein [Edaphobacter sp.]|uniref:tetratricopeptide repeat protein n=1 Tax=Edaphobacter sp. TaxID=1934404 RepID=UPI00238227B8|nr:tetratricopeptide repeat protein [Edaphobacter sp.]MDE1176124.1 tetratricopeptide repeat protein [Edaphobacter sp.]